VQITRGRVEVFDGSRKSTSAEAAGTVRFLPRGVPHAYASRDSRPFELLSIAIK
jgi:hypothetical protein